MRYRRRQRPLGVASGLTRINVCIKVAAVVVVNGHLPKSVAAALAAYAGDGQEDRLTQRVYSAVRGAIRNLELRPGQMVLEREVAAALGLSRTPVREALVRLEAGHLVPLIPGPGF